MSQYLSDEESLRDLESHISPDARELYTSFRHKRVEAAFVGRIYILYKPTGLTQHGVHKAPQVIGRIRVTHFECDAYKGSMAVLEDMETNEEMEIDHIPKAVFDFPVFVSIPPYQRLRYDGRVVGGAIKRSLAFGLLIKTRTKSDFYSQGVTMFETPKGIKQLYPDLDLNIQLN